jgi:acyl-CoA synthetase (NDP forming)/GNAT superfamily N-acetyltransferase
MADGGVASPGPGVYPQRWEADVVLGDGGTVHIRPVRPDDADALAAFHLRQSAESVYLRYFTAMPVLTPRMLANLTGVDYVDHMAFVVELGDDIVAMGSFDRWPERTVAEVAFMVDEDHRGRGLATVLLEYLVVAAREVGLTGLAAMVLPSNTAMLTVFHRAGFESGREFADGLIEVTLAIEPDADAAALIERRSSAASARSVQRLLAPRSVAVVGVGREPGGLGHELFANVVAGGFTGPVYPVNPRGGTVAGVTVWPSVVDIPDDIDLAVLTVPAAVVPQVVADCARKRVRSLLVVAAGFDRTAELATAATDGDDVVSTDDVVGLARRWGMRLAGPESLGVVNTSPDVSLVATFAPVRVRPGPVGLLTQSGTMGVAALDLADRCGVGISTFVDVGAKGDVSGNDVLEYWERDGRTRLALLYLESFGNPRKFVRIARRMAATVPIVAVKAGDARPPLRGDDGVPPWPEQATYGALLAQCGVIRVDNLREMFDVARVLLHQPLPTGRSVAVVSNSRGATAMTLDACDAAGLVVNAAASVELAFDAGAGEYADAVGSVADHGVDAMVVIYAPAMGDQRHEVAGAVAQSAPDGVTTVATFLRAGADDAVVNGGASVPLFEFPGDAVAVLGLLADHRDWLDRPAGVLPDRPGRGAIARVEQLVAAVLAGDPDGRWLGWDEVSQLAAAVGLPLAPGELVADAEGAADAARRIGLPVVLKATGLHPHYRAEQGGVALGLRTGDEVAEAHRRMCATVGEAMDLALVQAVAGHGVDVAVAAHQHPNVGAVVQVGMGGIASVGDRAAPVGLVPITGSDAERLVASSSAGPLLDVVDPSGQAARAVADVVAALSALVDAVPELADVVANPVIVGPTGVGLTDLRVRVAPVTVDVGPDVRRL